MQKYSALSVQRMMKLVALHFAKLTPEKSWLRE
jgi:hypothetical protein